MPPTSCCCLRRARLLQRIATPPCSALPTNSTGPLPVRQSTGQAPLLALGPSTVTTPTLGYLSGKHRSGAMPVPATCSRCSMSTISAPFDLLCMLPWLLLLVGMCLMPDMFFLERGGRNGPPAGNKTRCNRTHTAQGKATQRYALRSLAVQGCCARLEHLLSDNATAGSASLCSADPTSQNPHTGRQTGINHISLGPGKTAHEGLARGPDVRSCDNHVYTFM
jgi:hypothetical protein